MMLHGDCLELLPSVADGSVDMVFADLPYGNFSQNKWDKIIPWGPLWEQLLRIGKRNVAYVFTASQPFATALISSKQELFRYELIWEKARATTFMHAKHMPLRCHEGIYVFSTGHANAGPQVKAKVPYNPQMTAGDAYRTVSKGQSKNYQKGLGERVIESSGSRHPRSVLKFNSDSGLHPTQKPVALLEWLVKTYTNPGDTVLDPTMGSGTTGVACQNTRRRFIGIEKDAGYYAIAQNRIASTQPPLAGVA